MSSSILIVDDNRESARMLAMLLELDGHETRVSHDGHDALLQARSYRPRVVLLDIGLPGLNGYEVAERLRKDESCRDSRIIAITGYGREQDRRRSKEAGIDAHLLKPVDYDYLANIIAQSA